MDLTQRPCSFLCTSPISKKGFRPVITTGRKPVCLPIQPPSLVRLLMLEMQCLMH